LVHRARIKEYPPENQRQLHSPALNKRGALLSNCWTTQVIFPESDPKYSGDSLTGIVCPSNLHFGDLFGIKDVQ
jgi:hypothetical protein